MKNFKGGFAPLLIIAIVAVLAIGGGAYVVKKNKAAKMNVEDDVETQANANADANANVNANLGIKANANAKGSLRALFGIGKDTMCTFTGGSSSAYSSGTVYITAEGNMRANVATVTNGSTQNSNMIVKDGVAYTWNGNQGVKMDVKATGGASATAKSNVDLDSQVDYKCVDWKYDGSKFILPAAVNFLDMNALMKMQ